MSSTAGIQNLLVNVFRPVYVYDSAATTTLFTPKLNVSNIENYSGNTISVFTAAVGDAASNVYVGSNAGNPYTLIKSCSNVTALGYGAGSNISNVSNSVYLGFYTGAGANSASNVIAIGSGANGNGTSNIYIGNGTGSTGSSNILIGHGITPGNVSSTLQIGTTVYGDLSRNWIGINKASPGVITNRLDVSGDTQIMGQLGINDIPGERTLYVNGNFKAQDASANALDFNNGITTSTGGFVSASGSNVVGIGGLITVGTLKKGIINVATVDQASAANRSAYIVFAGDSTGATIPDILNQTSNGDLDIVFSTSNIQISNVNTAKTIGWSITYFPVP